MYLYQRIFYAIRAKLRRRPPRNFTLSAEMLRSLKLAAQQENCTPEELAKQFLDAALLDLEAQKENWECWQRLTPREQQVTALVCLNLTTRQIAARLKISPETVKTHAENALLKFHVPNRNMLRLKLIGWDFTGWER